MSHQEDLGSGPCHVLDRKGIHKRDLTSGRPTLLPVLRGSLPVSWHLQTSSPVRCSGGGGLGRYPFRGRGSRIVVESGVEFESKPSPESLFVTGWNHHKIGFVEVRTRLSPPLFPRNDSVLPRLPYPARVRTLNTTYNSCLPRPS